MTEEEFKTTYKRAFLESYRTVVGFRRWFGTTPNQQELLTIAEQRATIAWKQYLKDTGRDS